MSLSPILPPIQYALLHSVGAASLLFVLLNYIKGMRIEYKDKYKPRFISVTVGKSFVNGIFFLMITWVLSSFYIFLFLACCQEPCVYFERFIWTFGFIGCLYASASIFKLLIVGNFNKYFKHLD